MKQLGKKLSLKFEDAAAEGEYLRVKMTDKDKLIQVNFKGNFLVIQKGHLVLLDCC